jgi:hypothetical protein
MSSILKPLQLDESPPVAERARSRRTPETTRIARPRLSVPAFSRIPVKEYVVHLPILVIGLGLYLALVSVLNTVPPAALRNIWVQNSYAPFLLLAGTAHFCLFSYLFLSTRRGFLASLFLTIITFLKLQQVLTNQLIWWALGLVITLEVVFFLIKKIFSLLTAKFTFNGMHSLPQLPRWRNKTGKGLQLPPDLVTTPESTLPKPQKPNRRLGRKRKHHFFGK